MVDQQRPADILAWADRLGIRLWVAGDRIRYAPLPAATPEFVAALAAHKKSVLSLLSSPEPSPEEVADAVDSYIRLGKSLADGTITGLRCGINGRYCHQCYGVPCRGSQPLGGESDRPSKKVDL